ncbi:hypothetical protein ACS0TY_020902 [Phlomoides rotata]
MDSSRAQEIGSETLESILLEGGRNVKTQQEKKARATAAAAADMQALKCPRCDSANTKFCYYNNYSLSQPRYFCKSCRRYWTKGGTLRNVPVGGGCRKNKRSSSSSSSSSGSKQSPDQPLAALPHPAPSFSYDSSDLTLAIAQLQKQTQFEFRDDFSIWGNPNMPQPQPHHPGGILGNFGGNNNSGLFDALRTGFLETPPQNVYYGMGGMGPGNGNLELDNGGIGMGTLESQGMGMSGSMQGVGIPFENFSGTTTTAVKQEMCSSDSRVLWGYPWQNVGAGGSGSGGGGVAAGAEYDSGRVSWNGVGSSNWHGLLNSPLM